MIINYTGRSYEIELPNVHETSIPNSEQLIRAVLDYCGFNGFNVPTSFPREKIALQITPVAREKLREQQTGFLDLIVNHHNNMLYPY